MVLRTGKLVQGTNEKELSIPELLKEAGAEVEHAEDLIAEAETAGTGIHPADLTEEDREVIAETVIQVGEDHLMIEKGKENTEIVTLEEGILDPDRGRSQGQEKGGREQPRRDMKE